MIFFVVNPVEACDMGQGTQAGNLGEVGWPGNEIDRAAFKVERVFTTGSGLGQVVLANRVVGGGDHDLSLAAPFGGDEANEGIERYEHGRVHHMVLIGKGSRVTATK